MPLITDVTYKDQFPPRRILLYMYLLFIHCRRFRSLQSRAPAGSPSRGGNVMVYDFDINYLRLPTLFYSVLVSVSGFMALSTVFHSINSPDYFPLSHSVLSLISGVLVL